MKQNLHALIKKQAAELFPEAKQINFNLDPVDEKFGDYATNLALILAREIGRKPIELAQEIANELTKFPEFKKVNVAGPGFINFIISEEYFQKQVRDILNAEEKFGRSDLGKDLNINIEFISANPTGPLTLGNGRNAYFGDTLGNILTAFGAQVTREYYVNDRGAQILALGHSVLEDDEAVYKGEYIQEIIPRIQSSDPEKAGEEAGAILLNEYIKKTIAKMGINYNVWFSEKSLHESTEIAEAMGILEKIGLTYRHEEAVWLKTTDFGDDKDRVLITNKGEYTYFSSDIAYHFNKMKRGFNLLVDFWGADHHGYIGRLMAAVDMLRPQIDWGGELKIMICQLVRLMSNGQEVRMSKRAGNFVLLDELIDEVGSDVTRFFFLDRTLDTHMDFDLDLAKEKSDKNPVYYVQYAYARICSILAKSEILNSKSETNQKLHLLNDPNELKLIKQLIKLPELVEEISGDFQVQKLCFYVREIAKSFHNFYEKCPVLKSGDDNLTSARLELLKATQIVLKNTLDLLGVSTPEKM